MLVFYHDNFILQGSQVSLWISQFLTLESHILVLKSQLWNKVTSNKTYTFATVISVSLITQYIPKWHIQLAHMTTGAQCGAC